MFKSMKRIIRWAGKYKGRLYLGSVCSFFSSLSTAIPTMAAAFALDKAIQAYWTNTAIDTVLIWQTLWIIIGSIVLNFLLSYLRAVLQESIGYEVAAGKRSKTLSKSCRTALMRSTSRAINTSSTRSPFSVFSASTFPSRSSWKFIRTTATTLSKRSNSSSNPQHFYKRKYPDKRSAFLRKRIFCPYGEYVS